jgi:perosamine synthetase
MDPELNLDADKVIHVAKPSITDREIDAVQRRMSDGWISQGEAVAEFESQFSAMCGRKHGIACSSGTVALELAIDAVKIGNPSFAEHNRRLVLCPTMTMVAVPNSILRSGCRPFFVDSEPTTGNINVAHIGDVLKSVEISAIVVAHLYGVPSDYIHPHGRLTIIEDCSECHGADVGRLGDLQTYSFYANKIIACGEGGMVLTNDDDSAERLRSLRSHAFTPGEHFSHKELAHGARMTDLQAAIGKVQLDRMEEMQARRIAIAEMYMQRLAKVPWLSWQPHPVGSVWWVFPILVRAGARFGVARDHLRSHLAHRGIETRTWFRPMHQQRHLMQFAKDQSFPVADGLYSRGLYLPLYVDMTDSDVEYICDAVESCKPG